MLYRNVRRTFIYTHPERRTQWYWQVELRVLQVHVDNNNSNEQRALRLPRWFFFFSSFFLLFRERGRHLKWRWTHTDDERAEPAFGIPAVRAVFLTRWDINNDYKKTLSLSLSLSVSRSLGLSISRSLLSLTGSEPIKRRIISIYFRVRSI